MSNIFDYFLPSSNDNKVGISPIGSLFYLRRFLFCVALGLSFLYTFVMKDFREQIDQWARENFPFDADVDKWFVHEDLIGSDLDPFFGPLDGTEEFITFNSKASIFNILALAGIFPSVTQARNNKKNILPKMGLEDEKIPSGFSDFVVGKKKFSIVVVNK